MTRASAPRLAHTLIIHYLTLEIIDTKRRMRIEREKAASVWIFSQGGNVEHLYERAAHYAQLIIIK